MSRFVVGEICAAILSIHELGLAFNDLKPENVLITALGHIKVSIISLCRNGFVNVGIDGR